MKKLISLLAICVFCSAAYSQDSMNKKMENKTDQMNKKVENPNDPMNKRMNNSPDSINKKRLPGNSDSLKRKTTPKIPVKKPIA